MHKTHIKFLKNANSYKFDYYYNIIAENIEDLLYDKFDVNNLQFENLQKKKFNSFYGLKERLNFDSKQLNQETRNINQEPQIKLDSPQLNKNIKKKTMKKKIINLEKNKPKIGTNLKDTKQEKLEKDKIFSPKSIKSNALSGGRVITNSNSKKKTIKYNLDKQKNIDFNKENNISSKSNSKSKVSTNKIINLKQNLINNNNQNNN